jgi:MFS family permease
LSWKTTLVLALVWFTSSFGYVIGNFLPLILVDIGETDPNGIYLLTMCLAVGGLFGGGLLVLVGEKAGRLLLLRVGLLLLSVTTFLMGISVPAGSENVLLYVTSFLSALVGMLPMHILLVYTGEVHPTETRALALGICLFMHRLAPIFSPYAVTSLQEESFALVTYVFGSVFLLAMVLCVFLRKETWKRRLVEEEDFKTD